MLDLTGKAAFIAGAVSGIGVETARVFTAQDAEVTAFYLNEGMLNKLAHHHTKVVGNEHSARIFKIYFINYCISSARIYHAVESFPVIERGG